MKESLKENLKFTGFVLLSFGGLVLYSKYLDKKQKRREQERTEEHKQRIEEYKQKRIEEHKQRLHKRIEDELKRAKKEYPVDIYNEFEKNLLRVEKEAFERYDQI